MQKWNFKQKQQTKTKLMKMCAAKQNKLSFFWHVKIFDGGLICLLQKKIVLSEKDFYLWGEAFWRFSFLILLALVNSTFCWICLIWGNAPYLLPDRASALAICWWASAHPYLLLGPQALLFVIIFIISQFFLLDLLVCVHSSFCWNCLFLFTVLFVNFNTPVHSSFCWICLSVFTVLFACVFCHPHIIKKSSLGRPSIIFLIAWVF